MNQRWTFLCAGFLLSLSVGACGDVSTEKELRETKLPSAPEGAESASDTALASKVEVVQKSPPKARKKVKNYIFGHSLINHEMSELPVRRNENSVPHWLYLLAKKAGLKYSVAGQYGFLRNHAELPPRSQWGFDKAPSAWDPDFSGKDFSDTDFTTVLLTAANFIQYQSPATPFDGDNPDNSTPLDATLKIVDWVLEHEPSLEVYIYENWPDMAGFSDPFPPSERAFKKYNAYVTGDFHRWWIEYHNAILAARPDSDVKMIPVGPVIAKLLTQAPLKDVPVTELYEDNAPHGRPSIYFLAALVTYMSVYNVEAPKGYEAPSSIHSLIRDNYSDIVDTIWQELNAFNDESGRSRVW